MGKIILNKNPILSRTNIFLPKETHRKIGKLPKFAILLQETCVCSNVSIFV